MGGGKLPSPMNNVMPSVGGVQLPNPLNPVPPEAQMIAGAKGGQGGAKMDPLTAMGAKGKGKEEKK